jgi:hypothetical protein
MNITKVKFRVNYSNLWVLLLMILTGHLCYADWGKNFGGYDAGTVQLQGSAVDGSGNVYLTGYFTSTTLEAPGNILTRIGVQDAFVVKLDSSGTVIWAKNFGGVGATAIGFGLAVDGSSNVYMGGYFQTANLTTPALTVIGVRDVLAVKMDSSGATTWAKNFGGTGSTASASDIAVDGSGNVYLAGSFQTANLTNPALTKIGTKDALALKLDSSGNVTWAKNFGGTGASASAQSVAVDSTGNVYLNGTLQTGNLTTPVLAKIGTRDILAFKLDSSGATTWAKTFGGTGASAYGYGIAVDGSSNVYLGGYFDSANLTTPAVTRIGIQDGIAIKLDSSGTATWAKNFGGVGATTNVNSIAVDGSSNVYAGGVFVSNNLTTPALTKIGTQDFLAIKLDSSGTTTWAINFGGVGASAISKSITVDGSGNVYLGAYFSGANLTTPSVTKVGTKDILALKLDSSGTTTWAKNIGGLIPTAGSVLAFAIAKDSASGAIYLAGHSSALYTKFGSLTLAKIGSQDGFVVKMDAYGNALWAKNFGGSSSNVEIYGVAADGSGNVYLGGYFSGASLTTPALTLLGSGSAFAFKLDSTGATTWANRFGGASATTTGAGISYDGSGNVYLVGAFFNGNLTTPALTKIGSSDAFVFKLDSSGATTWAKNFGGSGAGLSGNAIAVDGSGNVFVGGNFQSANLTTPALTKIGTRDVFTLKLDSSGNTTWSKNFGGAGATASSYSIAVDGSGNIYQSGIFNGANLTSPALTKIGTQDTFAFKLDSSGNTTWSKNFGGVGATATSYTIAVDGSGNVYQGGTFIGANLTTPAFTKIGTQDAFTVKMDSSGATTWSKNFGGSGATVDNYGIAHDGRGNVYLGGGFSVANLTTPALTKIGNQDALVIDAQLFNTSCATAGKVKYDSSNKIMVFCDGANWQSMNSSSASTCTGTTAGKLQYYANGASSDFVWYAGSCRSAKSTTTYGVCAVNGKWEWDAINATARGCINGTWTSLKGW